MNGPDYLPGNDFILRGVYVATSDYHAGNTIFPSMELTDLQARNAQIFALLKASQKPLPSPSGVALELMRQVGRRETGVFEVCRTARHDPMLVAKTIQVANSALFAGLRQTAAVEDAVMRIGVAALARLAVGLTLVHTASTWLRDFDLDRHWRCALARGLVMQRLARHLRSIPSSEAFTLGLLSDIGQLAMVASFGAEAASSVATDKQSLLQFQRERWGFDQNQASAALLETWGFPAALWLSVLPIGQEVAHAAGRGGELALIVDVARCFASSLCSPENVADLPGLYMGAARLGMDQESVVVMLDQVRTDFPSMAQILDVSMPDDLAEREFQRLRKALTVAPPLDDRQPGTALVIGRRIAGDQGPSAILQDDGIHVLAAPDLVQGLEMVHLHQPQVLILDGEPPAGDMLVWCRQVRRELGPRLYILVLADGLDDEQTLSAIDAGVNDVLARSAESKLLLAKVRLGGRTVRLLSSLEYERQSAFSMQRELARVNANLRAAAYTDELTGLANRRALDEFLRRAWTDAERSGQALSCVMLDLDHFKSINDSYGHDVGDRVLCAVTQVLREQTRSTDMLARWGGEELLLVCTNTDATAASALAERMRRAVELMQGDFPTVTLSAGVTQARFDGARMEDVLHAADQALLQAKRDGRNRVVTKAV